MAAGHPSSLTNNVSISVSVYCARFPLMVVTMQGNIHYSKPRFEDPETSIADGSKAFSEPR